VNGAWVGIHREPDSLHPVLLHLRRQLSINHEVSIVRDIRERELKIWTDPGRCCRPLFIVKDQILQIKKKHIQELKTEDSGFGWNELLKNGLVELIDTEEEGKFINKKKKQ
jgi:DNA-directed RNA polymerase II subunit RPB2